MYKKKKKILFWGVLILAIILSIKLYQVTIVNKQLDNQISKYNKQLEKSKQELKRSTEKKEYYSSDEYIEKVAREQENLVKKNDIIFVTEN